MLIQKLKNLFQDLNNFYSVKKNFHRNIARFRDGQKSRLLVLLPDNIGDCIIQLPFLDQLKDKFLVIIHSNGKQSYLSEFLNFPIIGKPQFGTRLKTILDKKYLNFLGSINDQILVGSSFKAPYLIELAKNISSKKKVIYEGEQIHLNDYPNHNLKGFTLIQNPFKADLKIIDASIIEHLNHFYSEAFDIKLSNEEYQVYFSQFVDPEGVQKDLVVILPEAGAMFRQINPKDWQKIVEAKLSDKQLILLGTDDSIDLKLKNAVDLRGETTIEQAMQYIYSAEEVWAVETGFAHLSYLSGIKTNILLGGGHYNRFLPWHFAMKNLKLYSQNDKSCFQCNWDCQFTVLRDEPAPCLQSENILAQIINE